MERGLDTVVGSPTGNVHEEATTEIWGIQPILILLAVTLIFLICEWVFAKVSPWEAQQEQYFNGNRILLSSEGTVTFDVEQGNLT